MSSRRFAREFARESEYIERKEGISARAVQRTVAAFSNTDGGVLLIGVRDDGTVAGRALTQSVEGDITQAVLGVHDPGRFWLHELMVDGRPVVIVSVARRRQGFAQTSEGQVMVRRGAMSVPLVGAELLPFLSDRALHRFDETPTDASLSSAPERRVGELAAAMGWRDTSRRLESLQAAGLATSDSSPRLTVAGVLTLLDDPAAVLGKTFVEILRYPDDSVDYDRRIEIRGPVQDQVADSTAELLRELGTDLVVRGVRRTEVPKVPEVVIREAIANAVAHRSYEEHGRAIRVELRPDSVIVESPGGLPEPVTEDNIRETQFARNFRVISGLRRFRLAEDSGRGVDVMIDSMVEALLDPPMFVDLGHSVHVVLPIRGVISPQERAWILEVEKHGVIEPRDRVLLVHAARGDALTNERVRELLGVDSRDARRALTRLRDAGFLEQHGARGGSRYTLAGEVAGPSGRTSPVALRQIILALASDGPIRNADVRAATGVDRLEALRALDKLVAEGLLVRRGERRTSHYTRTARARKAEPSSG